jgi:fibronectin-binding autotransporter adhesin
MPELNYGATFLESNVDTIVPQSWENDVLPPFQKIRTLLNTTGLDYQNVQDNGIRYTGIRTHDAIEAVRYKVRNNTGGSLAKGDLVYFTGTYSDGTDSYPTVAKAISTTAAATNFFAQGVCTAAISDSADGTVAVFLELTNINTSSGTVGDPVYLNTSAGGWTRTRPTGGQYVQVVGTISVVHASTGRVIFSLGALPEFLKGGSSGLDAELETLTLTDALVLGDDKAVHFGASTDYSIQYDSGNTQWELVSTNIDGSGTNGVVLLVEDGTNDVSLAGGLSTDALSTPTAGLTTTAVTAVSLDISGDVDVDGTLEADAITLGGTALGSLYSPIAGSSNITTTGTVTSGTWSGVIDGTATMTQGSDATGDIYYRNASGHLTRLAAGADGTVLTGTGSGSVPAWESPTVGDVTSVVAGVGLSGGGTSGDVTLTLDISELSTVTPADGDFFATLDSDGANEQKTTTTALATLFAGAGMTASSSVLNVIGGDGITANANDVAITAAQTTVTSVLNASLAVGRDADNQIKFGTDDQIVFEVAGGDGVTFKASGEIEATTLDISGDADIEGTLEADAITLGGTALGSLYSPIAGSSNITTTGTVTSGTWSGVIDGSATMTLGSDATGDIYYRDASGFLERLASGADGYVLTGTGAGSIPAWEAAAASGIASVVADTSPQLGGNLDVNGQSIVSDGSNENIPITPHGTGSVVISKADINAGAIDGTAIGATSASTGAFTTLSTTGALTVGVNDTGHDVKFFGATSGKYMEWDESADRLNVSGTMGLGASVANANQGVGLHICTADADPDATANASNDELIIEGNTSVGISLLTDDDGVARLTWGHGSGTDAYSGQIGYYQGSDYMNFLTASTERMRILSSGGITFNGDTAAANALDDYEEGHYTPGISGSTTAGTWTMYSATDTLAYTKVGRVCTVRGYIEFSAASGSPAGNFRIGLPFANEDAAGSEARDQGLGIMQLRGVGNGTNVDGGYAAHTQAGSSWTLVRGQVGGDQPFYMQASSFAGNELGFWITITYFTS